MKRGAERQRFLENVQRHLIDNEEESRHRVLSQINTHIAIMEHFAKANGTPGANWPQTEERRYFTETILPAIKEFAQTDEEAMALIADLFTWEGNSLANHFKAPLHTQEMMEPEKVFDGHKAMDRVELE
jgi:hypothetical protein